MIYMIYMIYNYVYIWYYGDSWIMKDPIIFHSYIHISMYPCFVWRWTAPSKSATLCFRFRLWGIQVSIHCEERTCNICNLDSDISWSRWHSSWSTHPKSLKKHQVDCAIRIHSIIYIRIRRSKRSCLLHVSQWISESLGLNLEHILQDILLEARHFEGCWSHLGTRNQPGTALENLCVASIQSIPTILAFPSIILCICCLLPWLFTMLVDHIWLTNDHPTCSSM